MSYEFKKYQTRKRIVNAAQLASGDWQLDTGRLPNPIIDAETFSAHYEPVPEPPARECSFCGKPKDDELHGADADLLKHSSLAADDFHDFAPVSEEQPWPTENKVIKPHVSDPEKERSQMSEYDRGWDDADEGVHEWLTKQGVPRNGEGLYLRLAMLLPKAVSEEQRSVGEILRDASKKVEWPEAEAKAKLESLRGENNGA